MREMKQTNIEWIGKVPVDWEMRRLKTIGVFSASGIDKLMLPNEPLVRIINYTDIYGNKNFVLNEKEYMTVSAKPEKIIEHQVIVGDLLFTPSSETIEDIGISALVTENLPNTAYSYHILRFRFTKNIDLSFRKYLCNNHFVYNNFSSSAFGTIRQTLNRDDFKNTLVLIPPLPEQTAIANYLDDKCGKIDILIETEEKVIDELKEYKKSIIQKATTKGICKCELKDSGVEWIKDIPVHWQVLPTKRVLRKVKELCEVYNGEDIISLTMNGVIKRDLDNPKGKMPATFDGYQKVYKGNLLLCLFDIDVTPRCVGLICDDGLTSPAYSQYVLNKQAHAPFYNYYLTAIDNDKTYLHLSKNLRSTITEDDFGLIPIAFPPLPEQKAIAEYLDKKTADIDKLITIKKQKIDELKEYKKSLIYECVTGKKEVV